MKAIEKLTLHGERWMVNVVSNALLDINPEKNLFDGVGPQSE